MNKPVAVASEASAEETQPLTAQGAMQQAKTSVVMGILGTLKQNAANSFKEAKPWGELFDKNNFAKPASMVEATGRLRKNVSYFRVNYTIVSVATTSLVLFMNPWSLIVLAALALVWGYFYVIRSGPVSMGGRELSEREKFMGLSGVSLITIFFLTNVGAVIFYALGLSFLLVALHGMTYTPDDLFLDEPQVGAPSAAAASADPAAVQSAGDLVNVQDLVNAHAQAGGFLALLTGGGATAPPAATNV